MKGDTNSNDDKDGDDDDDDEVNSYIQRLKQWLNMIKGDWQSQLCKQCKLNIFAFSAKNSKYFAVCGLQGLLLFGSMGQFMTRSATYDDDDFFMASMTMML